MMYIKRSNLLISLFFAFVMGMCIVRLNQPEIEPIIPIIDETSFCEEGRGGRVVVHESGDVEFACFERIFYENSPFTEDRQAVDYKRYAKKAAERLLLCADSDCGVLIMSRLDIKTYGEKAPVIIDEPPGNQFYMRGSIIDLTGKTNSDKHWSN